MSKNNTTANTAAKKGYGKNTPVGVMPADKLARFKLKPENNTAGDASFRKAYYTDRNARKMFRLVKTYRQYVHKVSEPRLPSSLRLAVHYLLEPMARGSFVTAGDKSVDNDNSLDAVSVPLKV